ncbi:MAG: helix-turn-helix transcriptional regulator [Clostridia bacterium]|nr:helix-turn-helix transcriptional regulator [Clostridia bacterium]
MINYGEALKLQRELRGLSQSALAKATGLKQQMISWWEANNGLPNIDFCVQLANFYEISLDELIGRELPTERDRVKNISKNQTTIFNQTITIK